MTGGSRLVPQREGWRGVGYRGTNSCRSSPRSARSVREPSACSVRSRSRPSSLNPSFFSKRSEAPFSGSTRASMRCSPSVSKPKRTSIGSTSLISPWPQRLPVEHVAQLGGLVRHVPAEEAEVGQRDVVAGIGQHPERGLAAGRCPPPSGPGASAPPPASRGGRPRYRTDSASP